MINLLIFTISIILTALAVLSIKHYNLKKDSREWSRDEILILTYIACFEDLRLKETIKELKKVSRKINRSYNSVEKKIHDIRFYFLSYNPDLNSEFEIAIDIIHTTSTQESALNIKNELLQS